MAGWSDYLIKKVLDRTFGGDAFTPPATLYVALLTTLVDDTGSAGMEVYGNNYSRKAVTNNSSEWPNAVEGAGSKANANAITFATPSASWGSIVGIAVYDAALGARQVFTTTHGTDVINLTAHGYVDGDVVLMNTTGTMPNGLTAYQQYFVENANTNDFQLSLTDGGAVVTFDSNGTGTHSVWKVGNLLLSAAITTKSAPSGIPFVLEAGAVTITLTGFSDYLNKKILDHCFGGQTFTVPSIYCALFTTAPDNAGVGGTECSGTSYARIAVTNDATGFTDTTLGSGVKVNAATITFATPGSGGWGDVKAFAVYDALAGGNLLWKDTISTTTVSESNPPIVAAGGMTITFN